MSADLFYNYFFKGSSEELAEFLQKHVRKGFFIVSSLGVDYPEDFDCTAPYTPQEIMENKITEMTLTLLIVYRMHFDDQHIEKTIFEAMKSRYPNLEIDYKFSHA